MPVILKKNNTIMMSPNKMFLSGTGFMHQQKPNNIQHNLESLHLHDKSNFTKHGTVRRAIGKLI